MDSIEENNKNMASNNINNNNPSYSINNNRKVNFRK